MKDLAIGTLVLLLGAFGPQIALGSRFDAAWILGLLMLLAFLGQQLARRLHLPELAGWLVAGLALGPSGLDLVKPSASGAFYLLFLITAVWVGFQVGLNLSRGFGRDWRLPAVLVLSTLASFLLVSAALVFVLRLSWDRALLLGALAGLWGPFVAAAVVENDKTVLQGAAGSACGLVVLSAVLLLLYAQRLLPAAAPRLSARIWLSLLAGGLGAEVLWRLGWLAGRASTLLVLCSASVGAALGLHHENLYALPFGFSAGLVLAGRRRRIPHLRQLLLPVQPMSYMVFFALMGALIDVHRLWPPAPRLYPVLLVQVLVLVLVRGAGPALWQPSSPAAGLIRRYEGWLLLPRGALLFELVCRPGNVADLLSGEPARLLYQVVLLEVLLHVLVSAPLATWVWRLSRRPPAPRSDSASPPDA